MSNANPVLPGQAALAGDNRALYYKLFAGEILEAYLRAVFFRDKHLTRTIPYGKSASFPIMGRATAAYHTPGTEILGQQIGSNEKVINVEDLAIADVFIANIDEMLNAYDLRGPYARDLGQALSKLYDQNVARTLINAARLTTAGLTDLPAGGFLNDADYDTDGSKLWAAIFSAATSMDTDDIPEQGRYSAFRPVQYALIVRSERPIDQDVSPDNGSLATGMVNRVAGIPVGKTNNLPSANDKLNALMPARRQNDYSVTRGLVWHEGAAGTIQLQDVTMEAVYDPRRQGTLMLAKYLTGHDTLRGSAREIRTANPA